jgi:large subunit ribosomal protein L24
MKRIKKGDTVELIAGDDRGARGTVREVRSGWKVDRFRRRIARDPDGDRVVVSGVNLIKKHQRPTGRTRTQTGIIEMEATIPISNVMLVCPHCDERTRVRYRLSEDGTKSRVCVRCDQTIG